jgi:LacI family transcriptional regulator
MIYLDAFGRNHPVWPRLLLAVWHIDSIPTSSNHDGVLSYMHKILPHGQHAKQSGYFAARMAKMLIQDSKELIIFRQINEGRLGSNQQLHREEGFYAYMKEHHPDLKMWELNLYAKQPGEDEAILDDFFQKHPGISYGITNNYRG